MADAIPQAWAARLPAAFAYVGSGSVLGVVWLVLLVAFAALGLGLAVLGIGLPLLAFAFGIVRRRSCTPKRAAATSS